MDADDLLASVRADTETALSRLGSSKSLYAATGGEMDADAVLAAAADAEHAASETFRAWAEDAADEADGGADAESVASAAADAFAVTADEEAAHYETVATELDGDHEPGDVPAIQAHLRAVEGTVERAGALLGRTLAAGKSKEQMTGFFVGQADPGTADLFRDLRADVDAQRERALELLEEVCDDDEDWERAREAATGAIQVAYDEYTESLEAMGVNPKPVC